MGKGRQKGVLDDLLETLIAAWLCRRRTRSMMCCDGGVQESDNLVGGDGGRENLGRGQKWFGLKYVIWW